MTEEPIDEITGQPVDERRRDQPLDAAVSPERQPATGMTDDPTVATEEGVPWDPPSERVLSEPHVEQGGPDQAGAASSDSQELERDASIQQPSDETPSDDELLSDVLETLRTSDLVSGDRIQVAIEGHTVLLRGEVESVTIADEIASLAESVPGVEEVIDETQVAGL